MQVVSPGLFIESLTWPQVEAALKDFNTLLIPLGARGKEHGLHLPLNTDWLSAEYLTRRVAEQCRVMILPTVQYGYFPAFLDYPGSVSVESATFRNMICDICRSFARHRLRRFYVLNTGISTVAPLHKAQTLLQAEGMRMQFTDLRKLAQAERKALQQQPHGTHADELETSMLLYMAPQVVHVERAVPELAPDHPGPLVRDLNSPGVYSPTGAWGDPTLATAEKGGVIVEAMVREIVAEVQALMTIE